MLRRSPRGNDEVLSLIPYDLLNAFLHDVTRDDARERDQAIVYRHERARPRRRLSSHRRMHPRMKTRLAGSQQSE